MKKVIYILLGALSLAGFVASAAMFVMAIRFSEWGRFMFYLFLGIVCAELLIFAIVRLVKEFRK